MKTNRLFLLFALFLVNFSLFGQLTMEYKNPNALYLSGVDLLNKEKYNAAKDVFSQVSKMVLDENNPIKANSDFFIARCSYELLNNDALGLLKSFTANYPENENVAEANFYVGNLYYLDKRYGKAVDAYNKLGSKDLPKDMQDEYSFKKGYSLFMENDSVGARSCFMQVKDNDSKWSVPATYYYGHISYNEGQYEAALKSFKSLIDDEVFGGVVPYYISQIYYLQKKYDELIEFATPMLEKDNVKRQPEIARMLADAIYTKKDYKKTLYYLEIFEKKSQQPLSREDKYFIGYVYYLNSDYNNAIKYFSGISPMQDSLNQNASYHIADCYLKTGNKQYALNSFDYAYKLKFNPAITEDALFNYAKLSYELDYNPYNGAIKALNNYLNDFPNSMRAEEAKELLADLLVSKGNYKDAISVIENIKIRNERIMRAYQKVNYYHGIENFNSNNFKAAQNLFNNAIIYNYDAKIRSEAMFWKGESQYKQKFYDSAAVSYNLFVKYPASTQVSYYNRAFYSLGYAQMHRKNYKNAAESFETYLKNSENDDKTYINDASLRLADCYFATRNYDKAISFYNKSISYNAENIDYALLQQAKCEGIKGNYQEKQNTLSKLFSKYPNSKYSDDALYESGITYEIQNKNNSALVAYEKIISDYPNSNLRADAMLKRGSIYRVLGQNDNAINEFKQLIEEYKGSEQSKQAWMNLKAIYTDIDQINTFMELVSTQGKTISSMEKDSMIYQAAENKYMDGDCETSAVAFGKYIEEFPNGSFVKNAQFYRAECLYGQKNFTAALQGYEYIISQPFSTFTETSLLKAARINYNAKEYEKSLDLYNELLKISQNTSVKIEAQRGVMFSKFYTEQYDGAILEANKIVEDNSISQNDRNEAQAVIARSAYMQKNMTIAQKEFTKLLNLKSTELGAEANYYLAEIEYVKNNYTEAEKLIFDLINNFASFEYWVAKSFILLSDVYVATNNLYQAEYTLQSIIDNYKGDDLVNEAQQKLDKIKSFENEDKSKEIKE